MINIRKLSVYMILLIVCDSCHKRHTTSQKLAEQYANWEISNCGYYAFKVGPDINNANYDSLKSYMQSKIAPSSDLNKTLFFQRSYPNMPAIYLRATLKDEWQFKILCNADSVDQETCQYVMKPSKALLNQMLTIAKFDSIQYYCVIIDEKLESDSLMFKE